MDLPKLSHLNKIIRVMVKIKVNISTKIRVGDKSVENVENAVVLFVSAVFNVCSYVPFADD